VSIHDGSRARSGAYCRPADVDAVFPPWPDLSGAAGEVVGDGVGGVAVEGVSGAVIAAGGLGAAWRVKSCMLRSDTPASKPTMIALWRGPRGSGAWRCRRRGPTRQRGTTRCRRSCNLPAAFISSGPCARPSMVRLAM
jgi:hypothetical protein